MALPFHALQAIKPHLRGKVLSLGFPDIQATPEELESLFGFGPTKFDGENNLWHGNKEPLPDALELFSALGIELTVVDYTRDRDMEVIADLNYPHDFGKFDLVIDPGTLEHCFNIGQAFLNAANAVKAGGAILHLSPMTMLNHGFYNLSPTLFHDFYFQNGWDVKDLAIIPFVKPKIHATNRFSMFQEYLARVIAVRGTEDPLKYPTQTKYLKKEQIRNEVRLRG